ncbi:MAG TPA: coproporphyrinogen-III oxidase family protein [Acidimicrobiales bacterium]
MREGLLPDPREAYLTGTYPPLKAMRDVTGTEVFAGATSALSLYVHIPFCRQRCTFCHFAKEIRPGPERVRVYLDALVEEMGLVSSALGDRRRIASVYVGGGTPSSLDPGEAEHLLAALSATFGLDATTEFTFELHPQVVRTPSRLAELLDALVGGGVNRIAFGAQTLDDTILRTLNRGHSARDVLDLVDALQVRGIENYSIDLMYGLPDESLEGWFGTLSALVEAGVPKFNVFPLFFKVTDPISSLYERRPERFPDRWQRLRTHFLTEAYLGERGYRTGPVLYYSLPDHHSIQQELKFDDSDDVNLVGLGVSAFGYVGGTQYYNQCTIDDYLDAIRRGNLPVWRGETLDADERARRAAMFALRSAGISRRRFSSRFGQPPEQLLPEIDQFAQLGLLTCADDVWQTTSIGSYCVDGMAARFASERVRRRVRAANRRLAEPRRSPIEQHDYSPLGRSGASVPHPRPGGSRR